MTRCILAVFLSVTALALACAGESHAGTTPAKSPLVLFGAQSGRPTEADVVRTLETAKAAGYGGFIVYPRSGLGYAYMGEEWLALVGQYLKHAERLGLDIWLYDEFNWPSGSCKGKVCEENDDFRNTMFGLVPRKDGTFEWKFVRAGTNSANCFDREAMDRFRALTHEVYERRFRRYFGTVIRGIFTDEPGSCYWTHVPGAVVTGRWYRDLEKDYRAETGRDFRTDVEAYAHDRTKDAFWDDYTAVLGHAFRRAFADPITAWCTRLGIVSTGHLMEEVSPHNGAADNGLTLHVLKGLSFPAIDEIYTKTTQADAEWLTLATGQHAIGRVGHGGAAEMFALGPCDITFDKRLQMIWLMALHKVDTYFLSLHHQSAAGFLEKPHYAMFTSPLQPWFFDSAAFHDAAREASAFARKPFLCDIAVRYPQRAAGRERWTGNRRMPIVGLLGELAAHQLVADLYDEGETCAKPVLFDFEGSNIVDRASGSRFATPRAAREFAERKLAGRWRLALPTGETAEDVVMRRYADGTAAFLSLRDEDRTLDFVKDGVRRAVVLRGRGTWIYRPGMPAEPPLVDSEPLKVKAWNLTLDRPNVRRLRFLADGTARVKLDRPLQVRFALCAVTNAPVALDGKPLVADRPCTMLGFGYDGDYRMTDSVTLAKGTHVLTCRTREDRGLFLPIAFMEGVFCETKSGSLAAPPAQVRAGTLVKQGLGDYAGKVTYRAKAAVPADAARLVLDTGRALAEVSANGVSLGTRIRAPWAWEIPPDLRGTNVELAVTVTTSIRPRFGRPAEEAPGALPAQKPKWVVTIPEERGAGLVSAKWEFLSGPRTSERTFFTECLDTTIPALAPIPALVAANDFAAAEKVFADYVRSTLRPEVLNKGWRISGHSRRDIEKILDYRLTSCRFEHAFPYGRVDWFANPTYNAYREWTWQLSRQPELSNLAFEYSRTKDESLATVYTNLLTSWIAQARAPDDGTSPYATKCWRTIETGIRVGRWSRPIHAFLRSPAVTDRFLTDFFISTWEHGHRLEQTTTHGNWLMIEMHGLIRIGLLYPFLRDAPRWKDMALKTMIRELDHQFYPDGFQYELSTGYHGTALENCTATRVLYEQLGLPFPEELRRGLEEKYNFYIKIMAPDGRTPALNDGYRAAAGGWITGSGSLYTNRADFLWCKTQGKMGREPDYLSYLFPYAGAVLFRTSWKPDAVWGYLDGSPRGRGHHHYDKLNFLLFAYGKEMLTDPGNFDYDTSEMRKYVRSTRGHNTVMFDSLEQNMDAGYRWEDADLYRKADVAFTTTPGRDVAESSFTNGYGKAQAKFVHTRKVIFVKDAKGLPPFFAIVDRFKAPDAKPHRYDAAWHLEKSELKIDGLTFAADFGKDVSLVAAVSDEAATIRNCRGQKDPYWQGWMPIWAGGPHEHRPIPTPVVTGSFTRAHRVVTVLIPSRGKRVALAGVTASSDVNAKEIRLDFACDCAPLALSEDPKN